MSTPTVRLRLWLLGALALALSALLGTTLLAGSDAAPPGAPAANTLITTQSSEAIDPGDWHQENASLAADTDGNLYVAWADYRKDDVPHIRFAYRPNGGGWTASVQVDATAAGDQILPTMAVDGSGNAYLAWQDFRNGAALPYIRFTYRPAGGAWGASQIISPTAQSQIQPSLAVNRRGDAIVVWSQQPAATSPRNIYAAIRPAAGAWSAGEAGIATTGASRTDADVSLDDKGRAYLVWTEASLNYPDLRFAIRPPGGAWSAPEKINDAVTNAWWVTARLAAPADGNGPVHAVWMDGRSGNQDIYHATRPLAGSWSADVKVNDDAGAADQWTPSVALDGTGTAAAVWVDFRNGRWDIYRATRPAGGVWGTNTLLVEGPAADMQARLAPQGVTGCIGLGESDLYWYLGYSAGDVAAQCAQHNVFVLVQQPWPLPTPAGTGLGGTIDQGIGEEVGDPIASNSGVYRFSMPLLASGGPMSVAAALHYCSDCIPLAGSAGLPTHFWGNWQEALVYDGSQSGLGAVASAQLADGDLISFKRQGEGWVPTEDGDFGYPDNRYSVTWSLQETTDYFYLQDPIGISVHVFRKITAPSGVTLGRARLASIMDRHGNRLVYTYAGPQDLNPIRIEDGLGRRLELAYQDVEGHAVLVGITDEAGRHVTLVHEKEGADNNGAWTLRSVTDASGQVTRFRYTTVVVSGTRAEGLVTAVEPPTGSAPYTQEYGKRTLDGVEAARVTVQRDAYGNATGLSYDPAANRVTEARPNGATVVYEHFSEYGFPKSVTDPAGGVLRFERDAGSNRVSSVTNRLGNVTHVDYQPQTGLLTSYADANGQVTTLTYTPQQQLVANPASVEPATVTFYNLTQVTHPDGSREEFAYDARGNIATSTDAQGKTWRYSYNDRGQPLAITNPAGGVITYTYNADGTLATSADTDTGTTSYGYDVYRRLVQVAQPGGGTMRFTYDLSDRLLTLTDGRGKTTTLAYDANGDLTTKTNPLGEVYRVAYDAMGQTARAGDPRGEESIYTYDSMGRVAATTSRSGNTTHVVYEAHGWPASITDPAGKVWSMSYDAEGVPTRFVTPLGHTTTFQTDSLGRTVAITDATGVTNHFAYNGRGQLAEITDCLGRTTTFSYDAAGRPVSVTQPLIGTARYAWNDVGRLTRLTDLRGKSWLFDYSGMGRLLAETDPLGQQWRYGYDTQGRLATTTYPDGTTSVTSYDLASRVESIAYPGDLTLSFVYDDADRLLGAEGISLTRDERGDVTDSRDGAASFGASYDTSQRLHTIAYDGQATVTYTYDNRDQLARVEDSLTGSWITFTHDADGRLVGAARSNGVHTIYASDATGRITRIQDVGAAGEAHPLADQQYTLSAVGEVIAVSRVVPLDPLPSASRLSVTYDDAGQISSPGYSYDARGRQTAAPGRTFAYDGASRLTSANAGTLTVSLTYNGLGDLRTRTAGVLTTRYYHNYALRLNPIVAETVPGASTTRRGNEAGAYKRFYVYAPDGSLLYSIDPASKQPHFYHFDRTGSTLFLTDGSGSVTDAYAYDPYGVPLGHTGSSDQPFTYVGRYAVRWEPVGRLYDMRTRYYDPETTRFLTRDPVWIADLADLLALSPYNYASLDPLRHIDPTGLQGSMLERLNEAGLDRAVRTFFSWLGGRLMPNTAQRVQAVADATSSSTKLWDVLMGFIPGYSAYSTGRSWGAVTMQALWDVLAAPEAATVTLPLRIVRGIFEAGEPNTHGIWDYDTIYMMWFNYHRQESYSDWIFYYNVWYYAYWGTALSYYEDTVSSGITYIVDAVDWTMQQFVNLPDYALTNPPGTSMLTQPYSTLPPGTYADAFGEYVVTSMGQVLRE